MEWLQRLLWHARKGCVFSAARNKGIHKEGNPSGALFNLFHLYNMHIEHQAAIQTSNTPFLAFVLQQLPALQHPARGRTLPSRSPSKLIALLCIITAARPRNHGFQLQTITENPPCSKDGWNSLSVFLFKCHSTRDYQGRKTSKA